MSDDTGRHLSLKTAIDEVDQDLAAASQLAGSLGASLGEKVGEELVHAMSEALGALTETVRAGRASAWALVVGVVAVVAIVVAGYVGWSYLHRTDECNPLIVEHVLHQAAAGEAAALELEANGKPDTAAAIRALTDVDSQPDNVRLCILIDKKK